VPSNRDGRSHRGRIVQVPEVWHWRDRGSVHKTGADQLETLDFSLPQLGFTQKPEHSQTSKVFGGLGSELGTLRELLHPTFLYTAPRSHVPVRSVLPSPHIAAAIAIPALKTR
jgi:hypothetical protein